MGRKPKKSVDGEPKPTKIINPSRDMPVTSETIKDPAILAEIKDYATEGLTLEQIATRLLVTRQALYNWTKKFPEVKEVIMEGNKVADVSLELCTKGRKLANQLGVQLEAVLVGTGLDGVEKQVIPYGVDRVHIFDAEGLFPYTSLPHTSAVATNDGSAQEANLWLLLLEEVHDSRSVGE